MNSLFALALSTPIWGFSLQPPVLGAPVVVPDVASQVRTVVVEEGYYDDDYGIDTAAEASAEARNLALMDWTRALNVTTTIAMAVTGAFGIIQFYDEYHFESEYSATPCGMGAQGDPVFDYCGDSTPVPHLIGAGVSAGALISTFIVSTQIDFDRAARRDGDWRTYETTRWIALALGILQAGAGAFLANIDRTDVLNYEDPDDFDIMQGFAVAHAALGVANVGMNLANSILLF
ncbi:hypothetical protein [Sandaracinus amylolyticus]|nr:hypothetical protein [Sandaracinus amylolyticus]